MGISPGFMKKEWVEAGLSALLGPITKATWACSALAVGGSRAARKMLASREGLISSSLLLLGNGLVGSRCFYFLAQLSGK